MLRIAICDDEPVMVHQVHTQLERVLQSLSTPYAIEVFYSGEEFLCEVLEQPFDLALLDIRMKQLDGVEVGRMLREQIGNDRMELIYISSFDERAQELFELNTFRYLSKPIDWVKFERYICEICAKMQTMRKTFCFKAVKGENMKIPVADIIYFEIFKTVVTVVTVQGNRYQFHGRMKSIYNELQGWDFLFIHQAVLVNFDYIQAIRYDSVLLSTKEVKPIGGPRRREIRNTYALIRKRREEV